MTSNHSPSGVLAFTASSAKDAWTLFFEPVFRFFKPAARKEYEPVEVKARIENQLVARKLLTSRQGQGLNLSRVDFHGTDLSGVNFRDANLKEANLTGALLTNADLTGACIEGWNIDATTDLVGVRCDYIYLREQPDEYGSRHRRPADPARNFAPGEFAELYTEAICHMEILLQNQQPLAAIGEALQEIQRQHPGVRVRKIENRGEVILLGLDLPRGTDEAAVVRVFRLWQEKCLLLEAHNRDLKVVSSRFLSSPPDEKGE